MSRSRGFLTGAAALVGVCGLVAVGAQTSGAKTSSKGTPTSGQAFVADTHNVGKLVHAAGEGTDKLLGPGAVTLVFSNTQPTSTPGVVKATAKPMTIWLRLGTIGGSGTVLINMKTGALTDGHATFRGRTGAYKGHTLVANFKGHADLAAGRFHYTYTGIWK